MQLYLEKIVTGHARLARNTGGDDDGVGILQGSIHLALAVSGHSGLCVDVREIGSDAGGVDDIVKSQIGDQVGLLQEQGEGLSNSSGGAANDDYVFN